MGDGGMGESPSRQLAIYDDKIISQLRLSAGVSGGISLSWDWLGRLFWNKPRDLHTSLCDW